MRIESNFGQVADSIENHIHAMPCPGKNACPFPEPVNPESKQQADFYRDTGIWAPAEARVVLEWLMRECGFTAKDLAIAWGEKNIVWKIQERRVDTFNPWIESITGWLGLAFLSVLLLTTMMPLVFRAPNSNASIIQLVGVIVLEVISVALLMRYVVWPSRVAFRVRPLLKVFYQDESVAEKQLRSDAI